MTKKVTLKEKKSKPVCDALKRRILEVKPKLPNSGVTSLMVFYYPELDTVKKRSLMSNVLHLRQTDEDITEKLEALALKLNENNTNTNI